MIKKKYTREEIEHLVKSHVGFQRWDRMEGVYWNCWTVMSYKTWGFGSHKPQFASESEAQQKFREHLLKHFLKEETPATP